MALRQGKHIVHSGKRNKLPVVNSRNNGFTLIELMIAITIIGILASIAVPRYTDYVTEVRETDGRDDVYRIMAQQERYFLKNMAYTIDLGPTGIGYTLPVISPEGNFIMSASACVAATIQVTGPCIRITATGQGKMDDTDLWLESDGDQSDNL